MWKRMAVIWAALRGDLTMLWRALRHPGSPAWLKMGVAGLCLYLISPIDLVPDFIPFLGAVDDVLIVTFGVKWLLKKLPESVRSAIQAG
jgi:uncharacterized membrane protein YkvA (DUF1232 family)